MSIEQITPSLTWRLRRDVLYPNQKMFEMEMDEDADGIHFGAFRDNQLVGVVSLFQSGDQFQFRKLAVAADAQHTGVGTAILSYITAYTSENGGINLWCNARLSAIDFYLKASFSKTGKQFSKNGFDYEIVEKAITPALLY